MVEINISVTIYQKGTIHILKKGLTNDVMH